MTPSDVCFDQVERRRRGGTKSRSTQTRSIAATKEIPYVYARYAQELHGSSMFAGMQVPAVFKEAR